MLPEMTLPSYAPNGDPENQCSTLRGNTCFPDLQVLQERASGREYHLLPSEIS